jgi:Na+-transporting NADH:ubiquinone oxidoreductase subunit NqrD
MTSKTGVAQMMERLKYGLKGNKPMGAFAGAVETACLVIEEAQKRGFKSPTVESLKVILDNNYHQRRALEAAVRYLAFLEKGFEPTEDNVKLSLQLLGEFQALAVKARLHQEVPYGKLEALHKAFSPILDKPLS